MTVRLKLLLCLLTVLSLSLPLQALSIRTGASYPFGNFIEVSTGIPSGQEVFLSSNNYSGSVLSSDDKIKLSGFDLGIRQHLPSLIFLPKAYASIGAMQRKIKVSNSSIIRATGDGVLFFGELGTEYQVLMFSVGTSVGAAIGKIPIKLKNADIPIDYSPNTIWPFIKVSIGLHF